MLAKGADPKFATDTGVTPLMAAAGLGSRDSDTRGRYKTETEGIESLKILLDAGAEINAVDGSGQTAMHGAAFWGWSQMVQFLADRGAKARRQGRQRHDSDRFGAWDEPAAMDSVAIASTFTRTPPRC